MLILTRRVGDTIIINGDIDVTVLGVKGDQVRIGVEAPREVSINRAEIQEKIDKKKRDESLDDQECSAL